MCDGYEMIDRKLAVLASARNGVAHARLLRTYSRRLTLFVLPQGEALGEEAQAALAHEGIELVHEGIDTVLAPAEGGAIVRLTSGRERHFDGVYPMLGHEARAGLALRMGAECRDHGELAVDGRQQTSVPGLYAAGDVVNALNQMAVGIGHAATPATTVHNSLGRNAR